MDRIKLINDNCITVMKRLESNSVDLVVADPPYNLKKNYIKSKDNLTYDNYLRFSKRWLSEAINILKPGGTIYTFMGMRYISYLFIIMKELGLKFDNWITWHYTQGLGKRKSFSSRHDDILMFSKPGERSTFNLNSVRVPQKYYRKINNMRGANPGNVWNFSHVHYSNKSRLSNPTQKPEGVIERMILASSNKGDLVLDPFSGSGTTMRVAQQTDRCGLGIELDETYFSESKKRLKEPFKGFDSIDIRMLRVPRDLNNSKIRNKYFHNHIKWFLHNHSSSVKKYLKNFLRLYGDKMTGKEFKDFKSVETKFNCAISNKDIKKFKGHLNKLQEISLF